VAPGSAAQTIAEAIGDKLESYPILNEDHLSQLEYEEYCEAWRRWGAKEFRRELVKELALNDEQETLLDAIAEDVLMELYEKQIPSGDYMIDGSPSQVERAAKSVDIEELRELLDGVKA
jgi:hypothetical protein